MAQILVTGMAGGLSQLIARRLLQEGHEVVGVDYRPVPPLPDLPGMITYRANYNKTAIEDVFRRHAFERVLHLGRVGNLKEDMGKRFDLNVVGSQKIMNLCLQYGIKRLLVLSTFHIYGASPANHIPIAEDEPLRAGSQFPQLADAIQLDNMAATWVYQHREVLTAVLRVTNVVGPSIHNTMSNFLRGRQVPFLMGFNPMTQFIHEDDLTEALYRAQGGEATGIFNVCGREAVPWRTALELCQARTFPLPSALVAAYLKIASVFPEYLVNFFKYPCVISDRAFQKAFDFEPQVSVQETLWSTVREARELQRKLDPSHRAL